MNFSGEDDAKLIAFVQLHPVLYQLNHGSYHNNALKEKLWKRIDFLLEKPVSASKKRWKTIRDAYRKHQSKIMKGASTSSLGVSKYNNDNLKFLDDDVSKKTIRKSITGRSSQNSDEYCDEIWDKKINELYEEEYLDDDWESLKHNSLEVEIKQEFPEEVEVTYELFENTDLVKDEKSDTEDIKQVSPSNERVCFKQTENDESAECSNTINLKRLKAESATSVNCGKRLKHKKMLDVKSLIDLKRRKEHADIIREILIQAKNINSAEHPIETFFRSMAKTALTFPPHILAETKVNVCKIVAEMELKALAESNNT